jgi:DNA invertase Pin-like site-specific DNA recombinase
VGKIFTDRASGKDVQRPELVALLSYVQQGDTVIYLQYESAGSEFG